MSPDCHLVTCICHKATWRAPRRRRSNVWATRLISRRLCDPKTTQLPGLRRVQAHQTLQRGESRRERFQTSLRRAFQGPLPCTNSTNASASSGKLSAPASLVSPAGIVVSVVMANGSAINDSRQRQKVDRLQSTPMSPRAGSCLACGNESRFQRSWFDIA